MQISRKTIAKYLGYRGREVDAATDALISRALRELEAVTPRHVLRRLPMEVVGNMVSLGGLALPSADLAGHLTGCGEAVLLAATLGAQADQLIRAASVSRMSLGVVLQASAAAMLEAYLNHVGAALNRELQEEGLHLTPRFSPGYGDLSLKHQQAILTLLEAGKRIGLTATKSCMLLPSKSVTAILGVSPNPQIPCVQACLRCSNTACPFREE